jgi:hypothetical protein
MDRGRVFSNKSDIMRMVINVLEEERVDYSLPASKGGQVHGHQQMSGWPSR